MQWKYEEKPSVRQSHMFTHKWRLGVVTYRLLRAISRIISPLIHHDSSGFRFLFVFNTSIYLGDLGW